MTHMRQVDDSEGDFRQWRAVGRPCPHCRSAEGWHYRLWESSDGAYEDEQHKCTACGRIWWVDGPDA